MGNILTVLALLFGIFQLSTELVITRQSVVGMKGSKVTLDCKYHSSDRWYLMQWKRQLTDKTDVTITTLVNHGKTSSPTPIWEEGIEDNFRTRARTSVFVDVNNVDFTLFINDFSCNDTGTYICLVTAANSFRNTTNLTITAKPERPTVLDDEVILEENDTYTLECTAMAGIPEADLRWYYKIPGTMDFVRIDEEYKQETIEVDECNQRAIQKIDVSIKQYLDGITYRCKVESDLLDEQEKESFYDDVVLKLPKKIIHQPEYKVPTERQTDYTNKSSSIQRYMTLLLTLMMFCICIYL